MTDKGLSEFGNSIRRLRKIFDWVSPVKIRVFKFITEAAPALAKPEYISLHSFFLSEEMQPTVGVFSSNLSLQLEVDCWQEKGEWVCCYCSPKYDIKKSYQLLPGTHSGQSSVSQPSQSDHWNVGTDYGHHLRALGRYQTAKPNWPAQLAGSVRQVDPSQQLSIPTCRSQVEQQIVS